MVEVSTCVIDPQFLVGPGDPPITMTRASRSAISSSAAPPPPMMVFPKDRVAPESWAVNTVQHQNDPNPTVLGSVIATAVL